MSHTVSLPESHMVPTLPRAKLAPSASWAQAHICKRYYLYTAISRGRGQMRLKDKWKKIDIFCEFVPICKIGCIVKTTGFWISAKLQHNQQVWTLFAEVCTVSLRDTKQRTSCKLASALATTSLT